MTDQEKQQLESLKADYHKLQVGWDKEIQDHVDTKAAHEKKLADLTQAHQQHVADLHKEHRLALLKEKQRVDRIEFEVRMAAQEAAIQAESGV